MAAEELSALDATFLELEEADHSAHMHIGGVMLFEPPEGVEAPDLETVRAELLARLGELPRFSQRLSEPRTGGLHWPRWIEDERFDIARHVRAAALPGPAGEKELRDWAGEYFSQRLDRARPLWEAVVIELADGRWALVTKTHHCMVDGVGSVDIGQMILDDEPGRSGRASGNGRHAEPAPPPPPPSRSATEWVLGPPRALGSIAAHAAGTGLDATRAVAKAVAGSVETVVHRDRARDAFERARALVRVLLRDELVAAPQTSLNQPIGAARRLAVVAVSLDERKQIKRGLGGTVNDVVLAATAGGLLRLFASRGEEPPAAGVRAMVPVNIRTAAERLQLGNKITSLFVHLVVAEEDPLRRYRLQLEEAERLKAGDQAVGSREIIELAAHAPPVIHTFLAQALFATRLFNITVTNVPGPQTTLYAFGSRMAAVWPLVPLAAEHALGVAVFSYAGRVFFCLNAARDSVPDLDLIAEGIADSIEELKALAAEAPAAERTRG